ncbi:MAG: hypothetical protein QNJ54_10035 [Prochloraceae cyanobacterium]|nr:hypothetical protein [Prochloraceae cyanobacterium]
MIAKIFGGKKDKTENSKAVAALPESKTKAKQKKQKQLKPADDKTAKQKQLKPADDKTAQKQLKAVPSSPVTEKAASPKPKTAKKTTKKSGKKTEKTSVKASSVSSKATADSRPAWVRAMDNTRKKQEEKVNSNEEMTFATQYLIPTPTKSRRRPGPSLDMFKDMARQAKIPANKR